LDRRARSYLHANCSICHIAAGGGNSAFDAEINAKPDEARLIDAVPVHARFGLDDARVIAPGRPEASVLLHRMSFRGRGQMPPLASGLVDREAVELLQAWIAQLPEPTSGAAPKNDE
jgi:mono/diheme cytochrome c family protein